MDRLYCQDSFQYLSRIWKACERSPCFAGLVQGGLLQEHTDKGTVISARNNGPRRDRRAGKGGLASNRGFAVFGWLRQGRPGRRSDRSSQSGRRLLRALLRRREGGGHG